MIILQRLLSLFRKNRLEQELDEELRTHLEMQIEDYQRQGMSAVDARHAALKKFGGVDQVKEKYRDTRGIPVIETLLRDVRYGMRMLRRSPGITIVAVLSLALGIGVNTALFSAVDAVLLQDLRVREPEQLIVLQWQSGNRFRLGGISGTSNVSAPPGSQGFSLFRHDVFLSMDQARRRSPDGPLTDLVAFGPIAKVTTRLDRQGEVIDTQAVSGNYYTAFGVQPILGRGLNEQDDQKSAPPVVVISNKLWRERFLSDQQVIGRQLLLNKQSFTIVGVDPPEFEGALQVDYHPAITIALAHEPTLAGKATLMGAEGGRQFWWLNVMGRLRHGATADQARESLNGPFQAAALESMPPPRRSDEPAQLDANEYPRLTTESGSRGMPDTRKEFAPTIYGLFIVVGVVLLIACANLANLLLARGAARGSEMSVRLAVGAGRWRVIRQLLTESLLLSAIGGVVAVVFAYWSKHLLVSLTDTATRLIPEGVDLQLNWRVLLFTLGLSLFTGVLFGLMPAWRTTSIDLATSLKQSRRATSVVSRATKVLLIVQVALSSLLLVGAGLFVKTLYNLQRVELGFNQHNLLLFTLQPEKAGYEGDKLLQLYQHIFAGLDQQPGVRGATFGTIALIANDVWTSGFMLPGEVKETAGRHHTLRQMVRENYFTTMEIPMLRGRQFTPQDGPTAVNVAIVNQSFAHEFFPGQEVLGQKIKLRQGDRSLDIVGVVADARYQSQRTELRPVLYTPWQQEEEEIGTMHFAVRTDTEPTALANSVRKLINDIDSNLPVTEVTTQSARAQATLGQERLYARLLTFFGIVALLLASIGLFGVLAHSVSQRTREIGIRMAFGARIGTILRLVIWEGMKLVLVGLALGALTGYGLKRFIEWNSYTAEGWRNVKSQLYGVSLADPVTLIIIAGILIAVALVACWLPARRAAKVDPLVALRYE